MPVVFIRIESSVSESIDPVNPMKMIARLSVIIVNTMTTLSTQRIATLCLRIIDVLVDVKQLQTVHHDGENTRCQRVAQEKHEELHAALDAISNREREYLLYRFGFEDNIEHPLTETAEHFFLSESRAKSTERLALDNVWLELPWWFH